MQNENNNKRLVKNTLFLYIRMLFTLFVGLYTSRVVLATLGVSDYGLYNVVGGVVSMFGFLNATLSSSTQRFLNYEMGKNTPSNLKRIFSTSLFLHIGLAIVILLLAETIGLWFVLNKLNVPSGRMVAAIWVYQFSIITVIVQIIQLPFMSSILAHEKMDIYAYISIVEVVLKLIIVYLIVAIDKDKLILYAFLYCTAQVLVAYMYNYYCRKKNEECTFVIRYEKAYFKEMLSFSGWNVVGSFAATCSNQGLNILLNLFFGTVVNAARGIAYQINGIVILFANNFQLAVKPQIIKYYAQGEEEKMRNLVYNSARYSAIMLLVLIIPIFLEIDFVLRIWLGEYPALTPVFIRIILIQSVAQVVLNPLIMVVHASGYLKNIAITAGISNMLALPLCYLVLKLGGSPELAISVRFIFLFSECYIELYWMNRYIKFPIIDFYYQVYAKIIFYGILMAFFPIGVYYFVPNDNIILKFFVVCFVSLISSCIVVYNWVLNGDYKILLKKRIKSIYIR